MTTRRIISTEKTVLDRDEIELPPAKGIAGKGNTTPAVSTAVIVKLLLFAVAMVVGPIGTYYGTMATIFRDRGICGSAYAHRLSGNTTLAGMCAALVANVILVAYILVAIKEDQGEPTSQKSEGKKTK